MTGRLRIGIAAAVALALTTLGLMRLLAASTWIWPVLGVILVSAAAGELARRLIRPRPLVVFVQLLFVLWYDTVVLAHDKAVFGLFPGPGVFVKFNDLFSQGADNMKTISPGGASTTGITAILVISLGALAVLVDALAATYAAAPLAGLPLLALYLVPATRVGGGHDWLAFTLAALGYTALLSAEGRERLGRWGRPLVHAGSRRGGESSDDSQAQPSRQARVDTGPLAATGHQITMIALIAAVLAPVLIPTVTSGLFGLGPSNGGGGNGSGPGTALINEALDLKANLNGTNQELLRYTTSAKQGEYIRLQALDKFDGNAWTPEPINVDHNVPDDGSLASAVPGLAGGQASTVDEVSTTISYSEEIKAQANPGQEPPIFSLPVPYPAKSISVPPGNWIYDPHNLSVADSQAYSGNFKYSTVTYVPSIPRAALDASATLSPSQIDALGLSEDTALTAPLPALVTTTADNIVKTEKRPFEQAILLQDYFRDPKRFSYDVNVSMPNGTDAMTWLLQNKKGFCQTFSWTMAAMARYLGIPARVAIGFTAGAETSANDGTFVVGTHDAHAWPELYFDGIGWLRFEPTVGITGSTGGEHGSIPNYATPAKSANPTSVPTSNASSGPSAASTSHSCSPEERRIGACDSGANGKSTGKKQKFGSLGWFGAIPRFLDYWFLGGSAGAIIVRFLLLIALLVASVPMAVRILRRWRRNRIASGRDAGRARPDPEDESVEYEEEGRVQALAESGDAERQRILAAWSEVRDSATDLGYAWPAAETPRQSAERIIKQARFSTPAQDAMDRMTGLAERANYARTIRPAASAGASGSRPAAKTLFDDVRTIRSGLAEPVSRRTRVRATMMPASSLAALRERREELSGRVYERIQVTGSRIRAAGSSRIRRGRRND